MQKTTLTAAGIIILLVILLVVNGLAHNLLSAFSIDFTEEKLYSLSEGSKDILGQIEEPLTVRFYYSKTDGGQFPAIKLYGTRILNLLEEYERNSSGKILLEVYDPRLDSEDAEWAQKYGLTPMQPQMGVQLYLGLAAINSEGVEKSIPLFDLGRQEFLEYDVTSLVYSLIKVEKPTLAILSSLNIEGKPEAQQQPGMPQQSAPWFFVKLLGSYATVRFLPVEVETIADDVDALMVVHPKELSDATRYAIDQFTLRGGKLLVFVDPYSESDQPQQAQNNPYGGGDRSSSLNSLLEAWGVTLIEKKAVGDLTRSTRVRGQPGEPALDFALWISTKDQDLDSGDVVTSPLESLLFPWVGALKVKEIEGVTVQPLIRTSDKAKLIDDNEYTFGGGNPGQILQKFGYGGEEYILAARINGKLNTNFPSGKPGAEGQSSSVPHLTESSGESHVVVVADVDMLSDRYSVSIRDLFGQQFATRLNDNSTFIQNAVENMTGSDELISIRSRGRHMRPFVKVEEWRQDAEVEWKQEESIVQAKLNEVERKLRELQSAAGDQSGNEQLLTQAVLQEISRYREEQLAAKRRLREIRSNLRSKIEMRGNLLFLLNTFAVPALIIVCSVAWASRKKSRRGKKAA